VTNEDLLTICERSCQKLKSKCNNIFDNKSLKIRIRKAKTMQLAKEERQR